MQLNFEPKHEEFRPGTI